MRSLKPLWVLLIMADVVFFASPIVFVLVGLANDMSMGDTFSALVAQYSAPRINMWMVSLVASVPLLLLVLILWIGRRFGKFLHSAGAVAFGGSVGILLVTIFVNLQFWPRFLPSLTFPGWPHGIEFLLGPLFASPIAMLVGMLFGSLAMRR